MAGRVLSLFLFSTASSFLSLRGASAQPQIETFGPILYCFDESVSSELREAVNAALSAWSEQLPIQVSPCLSPVQHCVMFRIVEPIHGDLAPFSLLLNRSLAHTVVRGPYPSEVHFNKEMLLATSISKQEVYKVALHEVGHVIGIPHSTDPRSIMYPVRIRNGLEQEILPSDVEEFSSRREKPVKALMLFLNRWFP